MNDITLRALLTYIDAHIEEPLTLQDIAAQAGYSPYHFSRMFRAQMNTTVMDYVRTRKLQHALVPLLAGRRVIDIAMQYGFATHEGFTRAFCRQFQRTPSGFRATHTGPYAVPSSCIPQKQKGVYTMEVRFENWPQKRLIGYLLHTAPGDAAIPAFWVEVMADERWERLRAKADGLNYGICIHPEGMPEDQMDYLLAFDYDGTSAPDADMTLFDLPAASYAVFDTAQLNMPRVAAIQAAWTYAYTQWFDASGYAYDGFKPDFEVYRGPDACEVYIPIVPKDAR